MAPVRTFSIVAADPAAAECGVAVASKFLAAGGVVPWARAGVGAIATQAHANVGYGTRGLDLLASGLAPAEVVQRLTTADPEAARRQLGVVDMNGGSATFSGSECFAWHGGLTAPHAAVQGNILVSEATIAAMLRAFQATSGTLAARLLTALSAGDRAGGDRRGKQSAALLVVKPEGGYGGGNDRYLDLRIDEHDDPVTELGRVYEVWRLLFEKPAEADLVVIDDPLAAELRHGLNRLGYPAGERDGRWTDRDQAAFTRWSAMENLEERLRPDHRTDRQVLAFFRERLRRRSALR